MSGYRIISADDHVQEPKDMWQQRVPAALRERAPKVVNVDGGDVWMLEGQVVMKMGMNVAAGKKFEEYKLEGETYQTIRAGSYDPDERLKDMDADGVEAQVLFPNAFWAFMVEDFELQLACMRAYNDFLADFCQTNPRRLIGIGLVPTDNVEAGVREAQRVAKLGMRGLLVATFPKLGLLSSEVYDPIWAAAQDLGLPIHLHLAVGDSRGKVFTEQWKRSPGCCLAVSVNCSPNSRLYRSRVTSAGSRISSSARTASISAIATGRGWSCRCRPASISTARSMRLLSRIGPESACAT